MYNQRIKEWGICKHYKAMDKLALCCVLEQAEQANISYHEITFQNRPIEVEKVKRFQQDLERRISSVKKGMCADVIRRTLINFC
jgi:hypothetical protein